MRPNAGAQCVPVDELTLRDAVIAHGLLLIPLSNDQCELHAIHAGYAHCFGASLRTSDALRIIDELDVHAERRWAAETEPKPRWFRKSSRWPMRTTRACRSGGQA